MLPTSALRVGKGHVRNGGLRSGSGRSAQVKHLDGVSSAAVRGSPSPMCGSRGISTTALNPLPPTAADMVYLTRA